MNKVLYAFYWDAGRMGELEGLFISTKEEISKNIGKKVYLGEVLGKHSEVYGTFDETDIGIVSEDQDFINKCYEIFKSVIFSS